MKQKYKEKRKKNEMLKASHAAYFAAHLPGILMEIEWYAIVAKSHRVTL